MELIFFCRIAADLCIYFSFVSFLLPYIAGASIVSMVPMFIISGAALIAFLLRKRRVLSLAVMAAALFLLLPFGWPVPFIACLPPWIYVAYIIYKQLLGTTYIQQKDALKRSCYLILLFVLIVPLTAPGGGLGAFSSRSLPYLLFFMLCAVVQLRLLRPTDPALRSARCQLLHAGMMACITLLGYLLSRSGAYKFIRHMLGLLYTKVISPVFSFVVTVIATPFFWLLGLIFSLFDLDLQFMPVEIGDGTERDPFQMAVDSSQKAPEWIKWVFGIIFVIIIIWILFRFFRMLLSHMHLTEEGRRQAEEVSKSSAAKQPSFIHRMQDITGVRGRIRALFRQLCIKLKKSGLLLPGDTSRSVVEKSISELPSDSVPDTEAWNGFRSIYLRARYDWRDEAVSSEDVSKMREYARRLR